MVIDCHLFPDVMVIYRRLHLPFSMALWSSSPWKRTEAVRSVQDGEDTEIKSTVRYLSTIINFVVNSFPMVFAAFTMSMAVVIDIMGDNIVIGDNVIIGVFISDGFVRRHLPSQVAFPLERKRESWFLYRFEVPSFSRGFFR